jgi:DNA-binding HxlR family transcriptional regulator
MKKTTIKIIELLSQGKSTVSELAKQLNLSLSTVSETVSFLENYGLVTKEKKRVTVVKLSNSLVARELAKQKTKFSLYKMLGGSNELVFVELFKERTFDELLKVTDFSVTFLYMALADLQEIGAVVKKENKKFVALEELHYLITLLRQLHEQLDVEIGSIVIHSDKFKLKKAPKDIPIKGTPTAFSVFSEYNVEYISPYNYAIWPEKKLSVEEVFLHALKCSESKKDILISIIFYLKNKRRIDIHKCRKVGQEFKVIDLLLDVLAYLDQREVKNQSFFLPWEEFKKKAAEYGIKAKDKYKLNKLEDLLALLGKSFKKPATVYLIGGCNLALRGIKGSTKDIDLIVKDQKTFKLVTNTFNDIGFKKLKSFSKAYKDMDPSAIFEKPGYPRIDVFTRIVCNALKLNDHMVDRSHTLTYDLLKIGLIRLEDIILFKCITEREGDLEDAADIIRKEEIDWSLVFNELLEQEKTTGKNFCFDVLNAFELLEERYAIKIRILKKLSHHCLEQGIMIALEKSRNIKEIKALIDFPEYTIRNAVASLLRKKKIKKIEGKPVRFTKNAKHSF